jgi:hypothetical protein
VKQAEEAHADLDVQGLHVAADRVRARVPCVGEVLAPEDVARIHRVEGLSRFEGGDRQGAAMAFAAARTLDPDWVFPSGGLPEAHPLGAVYREVSVAGAAYAGVPAPAVGRVLIDGAERRGRPRDWPCLVQVLGDEGVLLSAYLWPDDPFPQVDTQSRPLALFGEQGFTPPSREQSPEGLTQELEHNKAGVRYDAVGLLQSQEDAEALIVWVLFTDPSDEVRLKAWRVLRARVKRGFGDMALQGNVVRWLAANGEGQMKTEAAELLSRLPAD